MIDLTPSPIAFAIGPLTVHWYGIAYAVGLAAAYLVIAHEARWRGLDVRILPNAMIVVAIAALIGGRLYHVIDQWQLYKDDPLKIVLPPYSGLGVYGGIIAGTIVAYSLRTLEASAVPPVGRRCRTRTVRDAGRRSLGQLLQPGAVRRADEPALGDRHRVPVPDPGLCLPARIRSDSHSRPAFPADVPLRVALRPARGHRL